MAYVDYAALKAAVSIEAAAAWLGLETTKANEQLRCECPAHGGGKRSLVITPAKQLFYCFAADGQSGGDVLELVAHCKAIDVKQAARDLEARFVAQKPTAPDGLDKVADYLDPKHEAVAALGLSEDLAVALGIGFAPKGVMRGRVLMPLRTSDGRWPDTSATATLCSPGSSFPASSFSDDEAAFGAASFLGRIPLGATLSRAEPASRPFGLRSFAPRFLVQLLRRWFFILAVDA